MQDYVCTICGFIYHETRGWPENNIALGTSWENVPVDWKCPVCGASKEDFEPRDI